MEAEGILWRATAAPGPPLDHDLAVDLAIIGGDSGACGGGAQTVAPAAAVLGIGSAQRAFRSFIPDCLA